MNAILLIADSNVCRRGQLRRLFSRDGFLVVASSNGLDCLEALVTLEPHILVIELEIPWGGGDGVIARLNDGLPIRRRPLVLVMGDAPSGVLSARTGVPPWNCFPKPVRKEVLLDRIGMEFAARLLRGTEGRRQRSEERIARALIEEAVR